MSKTYHASMAIGGYRSDNGAQDIVNVTFYGPRGGLRTLETLTIGEAQMLVASINDALAERIADQRAPLWLSRAEDKCGGVLCPDRASYCSCRKWADERSGDRCSST